MSTAAASSSADAAPAAADNVTGRGGGGRRRNDQNIARNAALPRPAALVATGAVLAAPNRSPRLPAPLENEEEEEEVNEYNEEGRFDEMPFNLLPTNTIKLSGANQTAAAAGGGDGNGRNLRVSNDHYQRLSPNGPIEVIDLVSDSDSETDSDSDEGEQNNNNATVNRLSIASNNSNQRAVSNNNNNGSNNSRSSSSSNNNNNIRNNGKNVAAKQHRPAAPRTVPSLTSQTVPKTISSATANPRLSTSTSSYFSCSSSSSTSSSSSSEDQSVVLGNSGGGGSGGARGRIPKPVAFNSSAGTFLTASSSSSSLSTSKHSAPKRKQKSLSSKGPKTAKVPKRTKAAAARNPTQVTPKFTCSCSVCFKGFKFPSGLSIHLQNNFHCNKTHRERSEAAAVAAAAAATTTAAAAVATQVAPPSPPPSQQPPPPPSSPEPQGPPYICRHCVRDFSRKCSLLEHQRRLHKAPQVSASHLEDRHVAQEGSQPQPQLQQLQPQPQLQQLQPQPRQECTICRLTFKNSHGLSIHSSKVHRTRRGQQQQQQQQKPKNGRANVVRPKAKSSSNNNIGISTENNVEGNDDDDSDDDDDDDGCDGFIDAITNRSNPGVRLESAAERLKITSTVKVGDTVGVLYDFHRKRNQVRPAKEPHFVYQAKVLRKEWDVTRERHLFLVHFDGWEGRWDEWITGERLWVSLDWLSGRVEVPRRAEAEGRGLSPSISKKI